MSSERQSEPLLSYVEEPPHILITWSKKDMSYGFIWPGDQVFENLRFNGTIMMAAEQHDLDPSEILEKLREGQTFSFKVKP